MVYMCAWSVCVCVVGKEACVVCLERWRYVMGWYGIH